VWATRTWAERGLAVSRTVWVISKRCARGGAEQAVMPGACFPDQQEGWSKLRPGHGTCQRGAPPAIPGNCAREEALQTPFGHDNDLLPIGAPAAPMHLREVRAAGRTERVWALRKVLLGAAHIRADSHVSRIIGRVQLQHVASRGRQSWAGPAAPSALGSSVG
jgi:hypothetical protein